MPAKLGKYPCQMSYIAPPTFIGWLKKERAPMSGSQPKENSHEDPPFNDFDLGLNNPRLISNTPRSKKASLIERIELKPTDQRRIFLGEYTGDKPPKGFSIEASPDPYPEGSLLTEISSLGTSKHYKLILHITNYGTEPLVAEVWQL